MGKKQPRQTKKIQKNCEKICVVGYKIARVKGSLHVHGQVFDKLEPCCSKFERLFFDTGHVKHGNFNNRTEERDGLNLVTRGNVFMLVLRINRSPGVIYEEQVTSCSFCGTKVELKCTKSVELIQKKVEVFSGYDEEIKWQEGEQERYDKSAD